MAFNNRSLQKLIDEEKTNKKEDFSDDFHDAKPEAPAPAPAPEKEEAPAPSRFRKAEPKEEAPVKEEKPAPAPAPAPAPVAAPAPAAQPVRNYNPIDLWRKITDLAVSAKRYISAGSYFRANVVINSMRVVLIELIGRANGINADFLENADSFSAEDKELIYSTYPAALKEKDLSDTLILIITIALKYQG